MIFAIALSMLNLGIIIGAYLNESEKFKMKYKAKVPKGNYEYEISYYDKNGKKVE